MATLNSFPNNADEYIGAHEVMRWLHGRTSGVYPGSGNAAVTAVEGQMQVNVSAGIGWITNAAGDGIVWWFDQPQQLDIDPAEGTGVYSRIDRIVVQWHIGDYEYKPELAVLKGTDATSPTPPTLTNTNTDRMISLAQVSIPAGATEITDMLITDERLDPNVCGIVTESVTADTSMVAAQYAEAVELLESAIAEAWDGEISDGAITRAKLAPALLNEIGVHSVNGADGDVVLDAADVGAMDEWELLWENASPSSDFGDQTVAIANIMDYDAVAVEPSDWSSLIIIKTDAPSPGVMMSPGWKTYPTYRSAQIVTSPTTGVHFSTAYIASGTSTGGGALKPYRIYGIKGVNNT